MKNKQNEKNNYNCVKCETGETNKHGLSCSCNKMGNNIYLTEEEITALIIILQSEIKQLENHPVIRAPYVSVLNKLK